MATFLFDEIIFGPVKSRRLGASLGINVLPAKSKLCNFNCVYCECGLSKKNKYSDMPDLKTIVEKMEDKFREINRNNYKIDAITFAGNGEPTIHPEFPKIIDETVKLRDKYLNGIDIVVLTNSTTLSEKKIVDSLNKTDKPIFKIDTLIQEDFEMINRPQKVVDVSQIPVLIKENINSAYIQTMFFKGWINDRNFDNTADYSLNEYFKAVFFINPIQVMIYSIARDAPVCGLNKVSQNELEQIANKIRDNGIDVLVTP